MLKDIGFWNEQGEYIPDIQEVSEVEMDKEITIDSVDVTGCCYYESKNDTGKWCDLTCTKEHAPYFRCESMPNCYYKQLKRLEQENAELKAENERLKEEIKEVKKYQYEQEFLEKEIEEQREKNKRLTCKILEVKALNETLNMQCTSQDCTQLRKLHQTLQEIKVLSEEFIKNVSEYCINTIPMYLVHKEIQQKITKAEEE